MKPVRVYQDGRQFYNDNTGDLIFESSIIVTDGDVYNAQKAREEFQDWIGREEIYQNRQVIFV